MFNLAIIGGGPAGYTAAEKASKAGLSVVLFEKEALGGTCLNVGCIPTKTLLYSAKQFYNAVHADKYGVKAENVTFDYTKIVQRKSKIVRKLVAGIKLKLQACTVVQGEAVVADYSPEKITIECIGQSYEAEHLLLCNGSVNFVPPIPGVNDNQSVWSSTDALAATELPQSVAIIGGGVIGMEFATLYMELGVKVTVIEALPRILPNMDSEIVALLRAKYEKAGVAFLTSTRVTSVEENRVHYQSADAQSEECVEADRILVCVGRRANLQGIQGLAGLSVERGHIVVDEHMLTNLPDVYAAGDITGKMMLAHVASRQAEVAVGHMLGVHDQMDYHAVPSVVYTNPEIASVGLSESEAEGDNFVVRKLPMTYSGRFMAENEGENGLCKMIVNKHTDTIVGVHMLGNPCSESVVAATMAVQSGLTSGQLQQIIFPHPTASEILKEIL